jgi:proliferating cell nuclear antigen
MSEIVAEAIVAADRFEQFVETLQSIVKEAKFHFTDDALYVRAVSADNVASILPLRMGEGAFDSWDTPGEVCIGVNLERIEESLGNANSDDLVRMAIDMEARKMELDYRGIEHKIALIDTDAMRNEPDMPDLELPNTAVVNSDRLSEAMSSIEVVSDHVEFRCRPDERELVFVGEGDIDETKVRFDREHTFDGTELAEETESLFSEEMMSDFVSPIPSNAEVRMQLGDEFPVIIEWEAFEGRLEATCLLAPLIRSD